MITVPDTYTQKRKFNSFNHIEDFPKLQANVSKETHHHSDSSSSNNSVETFQIQALKDAFDNSKCSQGNQGLTLCSNPNCQKNAIICFKKRCSCKKHHKNCTNVMLDGFFDSYELKLKNEEIAIKKVQRIFERLIDQISQMEEKIINTIKGSFLTEHQSKFVLKLKNQDFASLKGQQIAQVFSYINQSNRSEQYNLFVDQLIEDMQNLSKQSIKQFHKFDQQLRKQKNTKNIEKSQKQQQLKIVSEKKTPNQTNSKIVTEEKQIQTLKQFFTKKSVKQMKLLYRATQNNFSIEKFYEKCSNIPNTLILMKTQFNKIIGGFTPLIWRKYEGVIKNRLQDPSLESFIFSVSENEKLQLTQKENATYYLSYAPGPRFGKQGCADLWICDESNKKADSYVLGNMSYSNPKYSSCMDSYEKFVGGPTEYFKTKEWQVFEVQFQ